MRKKTGEMGVKKEKELNMKSKLRNHGTAEKARDCVVDDKNAEMTGKTSQTVEAAKVVENIDVENAQEY